MEEQKGEPCYKNIISEVKVITANKVAEKQKEEQIKFPKIIELIKETANLGSSRRQFRLSEFGEYTKKLLEYEGFKVSLENEEYNYAPSALQSYGRGIDNRVWIVSW